MVVQKSYLIEINLKFNIKLKNNKCFIELSFLSYSCLTFSFLTTIMVKQKRETGRSIGKQIKHKGIAQNRNVTWIENTESTKESEIGFGPEMEDGGEKERGRMTVQRRRRERERGRARCNLSQGPSAFLFYQQPIGPHTKRPLGFHSDGGHFAPRHPINSSRAVCNTVVMCCDTIYPPRAQSEACTFLRTPVLRRFENTMIASSGEN